MDRYRSLVIGGFALAATGCESAPQIAPLGFPAVVSTGPVISGTPTEVYAAVARGALPCWFGAQGPFKATHIFHADVPTSVGGAEAVLHERDPTQPSPRGKRVYRIVFSSTPQGTTLVQPENLKLDAKVAANMDRDVLKWAHGAEGCAIGEVIAPPAPLPPPTQIKKSPRAKA
jgi:hypothetical protein